VEVEEEDEEMEQKQQQQQKQQQHHHQQQQHQQQKQQQQQQQQQQQLGQVTFQHAHRLLNCRLLLQQPRLNESIVVCSEEEGIPPPTEVMSGKHVRLDLVDGIWK
jgi:hypothetical protein